MVTADCERHLQCVLASRVRGRGDVRADDRYHRTGNGDALTPCRDQPRTCEHLLRRGHAGGGRNQSQCPEWPSHLSPHGSTLQLARFVRPPKDASKTLARPSLMAWPPAAASMTRMAAGFFRPHSVEG